MSRSENIKKLLAPKSVVFIGGKNIIVSIEAIKGIGFSGDIWVVNPKYDDIAGLTPYKSLADLPAVPDAAFVGVRADLTVQAITELNALGCGAAVCYAAGFAESGNDEIQAALIAAAGDMAIMGPNCYGLLNYVDNVALWPDFHGGNPVDKGVAIISQSGNIGLVMTMTDRSLPVSYVMSAGNQAVLGVSDYIDALVDDERVTAIGVYIEGLDDIEKFSRAALRALKRGMPIVALKAGTSEIGTQMTMSHTSSLAGSDEMYQALFNRLGIVRVESLTDMVETLKIFSISGAFSTNHLGVLTCSGGDSAMMADMCETQGISLPAMEQQQIDDMAEYMEGFVTMSNPLDYNTHVWEHQDLIERCFTTMMAGDQYDAIALVLDYPSLACRDTQEDGWAQWDRQADGLIAAYKNVGKPAVLISNFTESLPREARDRLRDAGITPLQGLEQGVTAIRHAGWYGTRRQHILKNDNLEQLTLRHSASTPESVVLLDEWHSKQMLAEYGLSVPDGRLVAASETVTAAEQLGYPLVTKIVSSQLAHKTEAGAVKLNLKNSNDVAQATSEIQHNVKDLNLEDQYLVEKMVPGAVAELIVGVKRDEQFGPAIIIGSGGILVNLINDSATLLLPTSPQQVEEALRSLKGFKLLDGYRGKAKGDIQAVVDAVMAIANFTEAHFDEILELDVNPLMVLPEGQGVVAADALIRMQG